MNQYKISVKNLFKGYVVKDQFRNSNNNKFYHLNVILVYRSIEFYHKYWLHQNEVFHIPEKQLELLQSQSKVIKKKAYKVGGNTVCYVRQHALKEINRNKLQYAKDWVINVQSFIKNFEIHKVEDITKYIRRGIKRKGGK